MRYRSRSQIEIHRPVEFCEASSEDPRNYFRALVISFIFSILIILQHLFIWNNGVTNILYLKFCKSVIACCIIATKALNKEIVTNCNRYYTFCKHAKALTYFKYTILFRPVSS
jgi:hypothetical protein